MKRVEIRDINIRVLERQIKKNLGYILVFGCTLCLLYVCLIEVTYEPSYTSTTTIAVNDGSLLASSRYTTLPTANGMAKSLKEVFQSNILRQPVYEQLAAKGELGEINATVLGNTNLVQIYTTAKDPKLSYEMLEAVMENYNAVSQYLFSNAVVENVGSPRLPTVPDNHKYSITLLVICFFMGCFLATFLFVIHGIIRPTIKNKNQAREVLQGELLETVYYQSKHRDRKKKGKINYKLFPYHIKYNSLRKETFERLAWKVAYKMEGMEGKTLLVTSTGKGEGKSSVCLELAKHLQHRGAKVLVMDANFYRPKVREFCKGEINKDQNLGTYIMGGGGSKPIYDKEQNLYYLPTNVCRPNMSLKACKSRCNYAINQYKEEMDFIIIDGASMAETVNVEIMLEFVDSVLFVIKQDYTHITKLNSYLEMLERSSSCVLGYVLTQYHRNLFEEIHTYEPGEKKIRQGVRYDKSGAI